MLTSQERALADIVARLKTDVGTHTPITASCLAAKLAEVCGETSGRFDRDAFFEACGSPHDASPRFA